MTAFAVDIMLPGLAQIGAELGLAEANDRQFIITFYLVGFAVGQLFFGPLSDRFGRLYVVGAGGARRGARHGRGRLARPQHAAAPPR